MQTNDKFETLEALNIEALSMVAGGTTFSVSWQVQQQLQELMKYAEALNPDKTV